MKTKILGLTALCCLLLFACARRGSIEGGPKDTIAPVLRSSLPKNFSTEFRGNEIKLLFDEYVKLKDVNKQLVISPPMKYPPVISPGVASKEITVRIKDTLLPNTTYGLNFGQSIQDNNEGVPYPQFKYVFSTGTYLDSLKLDGGIKDALEQQTDHFVTVMLYELDEKYTDSVVYKDKPRYVTSTLDSLKTFNFENLKPGKYQLVALKDLNNNYKFDPKSDKIGFRNDAVELPTSEHFDLKLFKEESLFRALKPSQASGSRLLSGYDGNPREAVVEVRNGQEVLPSVVTQLKDADSVQIWTRIPKADSLSVKITKGNFSKEFSVKVRNQKKDTLSFSAGRMGSLPLRDRFSIKSNTPLAKIDSTKIALRNKDSVLVPVKAVYEAWDQELFFDFQKEEEQKYTLDLLPGALTDFFDQTSDSLSYKFSTKKFSDFFNLKIVLSHVKSFPVIIQLIDGKGKVLETEYSDGATEVDFNSVEPATFNIRLIYDDNKNRKWDSGNWLEKRQPEEVIYFPDELEIRSNWDWKQEWDLSTNTGSN